MRLNIEDFFRGATAVAQGTLAGKLQARQTAQAQRQQDLQNGLALNQAAEHSDEAAFQQEEANDQYVMQNILPKLTRASAQDLQKQVTAKQFNRQQRRQQARERRAAFAPPMLRPFLTPPTGVLPVTTTQPQVNTGPGGTPVTGATAGVMPGTQNNVQLPTSPAVAPPGAAPPPSPFLAPLAPEQATGMPTPEQTANTPYGPTPPAPPVAPGVSSAPGAAPAAVPSTPGVVTPASTPAAGGTAAPTNPRRFSLPGFTGEFEYKGVTPEQIKQYQTDRRRTADLVGKFVGDRATKVRLDSLYDRLVRLPEVPETEDQLREAQGLISQIESERTGNEIAAQTIGDARYTQAVKGRDSAVNAVKDRNASRGRGVNLLRTALARETKLAADFPDRFDPNSEGLWASFPDLKKAYDAAQQTPGGADDNKVLEEMATRLQNDEDERGAAASTKGALSVINTLSSAQRRDPRIVAKYLRAANFPRFADQVEKNGLTFGGYRADRAAEDFMKQADNWAKMSNADRDLWVAHMRDLAEGAGWDQATLDQIVRPVMADKPMTEYQRGMLHVANERVNIARDMVAVAQGRLRLAKKKMDEIGTKKDGASAAVVLRGPQHELDALRKAYDDLKKGTGISEERIKAGATPAARDAQELQKKIGEKYAVWARLYRKVTGFDPDTGGQAAPESAKPGGQLPPPKPGGGRYSGLSDAQFRRTFAQRLIGGK